MMQMIKVIMNQMKDIVPSDKEGEREREEGGREKD